jgi:predicted DNA-binding transcriptional regulator YafY
VPRDLPDIDLAASISRGGWSAGWRYRTQVRLHAPAEAVAQRIPPGVGLLEVVDKDTCLLRTGAETLDALAVHLGMLGADFEVSEPPELVDHIRALAERYHRATPRF